MSFVGLVIEHSRTNEDFDIDEFAIPAGKEADAGQDVLACLADGLEVILRGNDLDVGDEGYTSFRMSALGIEMMIGGHGWSGKWKSSNAADVLITVSQLAELNRGGNLSNRGSILRERR